MKIQALFLILLFTITSGFSQTKKSKQTVTNVHHSLSSSSVKNFDGTSSTIFINGNSATLMNSDGSHSTINSFGNSSTVVAIDGSTSSIFHNAYSSTVMNADGTQFVVSHMQNKSTCSTANQIHGISHFFGNIKESRYKNEIDVLLHVNWLTQMKVAEQMVEPNE